jgi:hypothetical protein
MFSGLSGFFGQKPQVVATPVVEENPVYQATVDEPNTTMYSDISKDITELVNSKSFKSNIGHVENPVFNTPNIFENILDNINTFIIEENLPEIKPIGKFKEFKTEERTTISSGEGMVTDHKYIAIFEKGQVLIAHSYSDIVLPKFYISKDDIEKYNELKSGLNIKNPSGGKPKTRRNIRKRQKKYSRKNRIKSRRNRLMK